MNKIQLLQNLGKKITLERTSRHLTLEAFAKQCSLERERLKRIENGEVNIRFQTLVKIAVKLEVQIAELLDY